MKFTRLRNNSGLTLTELVVSVGIMTFIFGAMSYMVFVTGRSTYQVREQAISQEKAAAAAERITNTLRNAAGFRPYAGDTMATTLTRVMYDIPSNTAPSGYSTGIVVFVAATNRNLSDGIVKIFENSASYKPSTAKSDKAQWEFNGVENFEIVFNSPSWITIGAKYNYRGFSLSTIDADVNGIHDSRLAGEFVTDVIAKNHHPGESAQYGHTTSTLFKL